MKRLLFIFVLLGLGLVWTLQHNANAELREKIADARHEKSRLQTRPRSPELAPSPRHELETRLAPSPAAAAPASAPKPVRATPLPLGEWLPPTALENRGQATPAAAVETALWAATGGDATSLEASLQIDETVRAKAEAILARLPKNAQSLYSNPEELIATFAAKSVPLGQAQLVWQHQQGPDDAVACVFVKNPETAGESSPPSLASTAPNAAERTPPMAPANQKTKVAYLSLHRTDEDGWRLVVPASFVDKIAQELTPAPRP